MTVIMHRYVTGQPNTVLSTLRRKVGALSRHRGFHQKIGITANPTTRWYWHRARGWRDMEIIYRSSSYENAQTLERLLIRYMDHCRSPGYYYNTAPGGEGRRPAEGPFYVYVINAPAYSRGVGGR